MSWNQQDNKRYIGKIDRIYVSRTEGYEVDYFVDAYLKSRNYQVTDANRKIIHAHLNAYPGQVPVMRDAVTRWIDDRIAQSR